jgi:hypothetical protein
MRRRAGNRKGNYASNVKGTMPTATVGPAPQGALYKHNIPLNIWYRRKKTLDNTPKWIITIFTVGAARARVAHAGERSQTRGSATTRDSESASPRRDRRAVCQRQLFRSQRSRPGQVRDAAPSFYQALDAFEEGGLAGLVPHKRGPKQAHKLTDEVLAFIVATRQKEPAVRTPELVRLIQERFATKVHPRSIERSLLRHQKKRRGTNPAVSR